MKRYILLVLPWWLSSGSTPAPSAAPLPQPNLPGPATQFRFRPDSCLVAADSVHFHPQAPRINWAGG